MKKSKKLLLILLCGSILTLTFMLSAAATPAPGSEEDPLVTRSYVNRLISDLSGLSGGGTLSTQQMDAIVNEVASRLAGGGGASDVFTPVQLMSGQTLFGHEGTELILRSGSAIVQASGSDGLANVTNGTDQNAGATIERNHLLIVPRADGRGIHATSDVWVLVKGGFIIH